MHFNEEKRADRAKLLTEIGVIGRNSEVGGSQRKVHTEVDEGDKTTGIERKGFWTDGDF